MVRRSSIALVALLLTACSVELGGQGDVTTGDPAVVPHGDVPSKPTPGTNDNAPDSSVGSPDAGGGMGGDKLDVDAGTSVPRVDAAPAGEDAAQPAQPIPPATPATGAVDAGPKPSDPPPPAFVLTSPAFKAGTKIPATHTCNGADISPAFAWEGAPAGTKSFVMLLSTHANWFGNVVDWQRWAMWNIPATRMGLPASIEEGHTPGDVPGAIQASNESDTQNWGSGGTFGAGGSFSGMGGSSSGGPGGGSGPGGSSTGGGTSDDSKAGRRYRGPCSYGAPQTFEFTLFAVGESPPAPTWKLGIMPDEIVAWLDSDANVLGKAVLNGVSP